MGLLVWGQEEWFYNTYSRPGRLCLPEVSLASAEKANSVTERDTLRHGWYLDSGCVFGGRVFCCPWFHSGCTQVREITSTYNHNPLSFYNQL